jgi:hypothetical protein
MRPVKEKDEGLTGLDVKLNESTVTQLAIVLSFFFGQMKTSIEAATVPLLSQAQLTATERF